MDIYSLHNYSGRAAELARRLKNREDVEARDDVADEMAEWLTSAPRDLILVPAPSSSGHNDSIALLAAQVGRLTGLTVVELVVRHTPVPSSYISRIQGGRTPSPRTHIDSMELVYRIPSDARKFLIIDNVVTTGTTLQAVREVILQAVPDADIRGLAFAAGEIYRKNPPEARVCISRSRDWTDEKTIYDVVTLLGKRTTIVHGGARGVDTIADQAARRAGLDVEVHKADWAKHGKAAGPIRNREMLDTCEMLIAFWDGQSKGTKNAIDTAMRLGLDVVVIRG